MTAILDARAPLAAEKALGAHGYRVLRLPPHPALPTPVASHPDMLFFPAPDAILCAESYRRIAARELEEISQTAGLPLRLTEADYGTEYPKDILFNAAVIGTHLFCNPRGTAKELLEHPAYTPVHVRQGYAKCSVIPVGDDALITSDVTIANAAKALGKDCLLLPADDILLDGYDHGLLGGCASHTPYRQFSQIFICGDLSRYRYASKMQSFCQQYGLSLCSLGDFPPVDVGTIFLI